MKELPQRETAEIPEIDHAPPLSFSTEAWADSAKVRRRSMASSAPDRSPA